MIQLYTDSSPNGFKITIALEELGLPYQLHHVRIEQNEHQTAEFLKLNPYGRIPVLVDEDADLILFESAAILLYLAEKTGQLLPRTQAQKWAAIKWLMFHAASVGPILGQRVHFELFSTQVYPELIERYRSLSQTALATLDQHLSQHRYMAGDEYSIADIAHFGWLHIARIIEFDFSEYAHLSAWFDDVAARPAVQRGVLLPEAATGA